MTVKTTYSYEEFQGNDVATSFPFDFPFFKKNDITVTEIDPDANEKVLVYGQDYEIPGVRWYNGGQVDLIRPSPLPTGYKLLVERIVDETQEFAVRNTGNFNPSSHEDAYDKLTMIIQQVVFSHSKALQLNNARTEWQTRGIPFDQLTSNSHVKGETAEFSSMNVTDSATIQDLSVNTINVDLVNVENQTVTNQTVKHLNVTEDASIKNIDVEGGDLDVDNIHVDKLSTYEETNVSGLKFLNQANANQRALINLPVPVRDDEPLRKGDIVPPGSGPSFDYVDDTAEDRSNAGDSQVVEGLIWPENNKAPLPLGTQSETININATRFIVDTGGIVGGELLYLWEPSGDLPSPPFTITDIKQNSVGGYDFTIDGIDYEFLTKTNKKYRDDKDPIGWGADPLGFSDSLPAFNAIMESYPALTSGNVNLSRGTYRFSGTWQVNRPLKVIAAGVGIAGTGVEPAVKFSFPDGYTGIEVIAGGNNAIFENFEMSADDKQIGWYPGFVMRRRCEIRFVTVKGFSGHGYQIDSGSDEPGVNNNLWRMEYCVAGENGGHGVYINGSDSNAGSNIGFNGVNNEGYAIYDSSFLGNHHYGCHQNGGAGSYAQVGNNSSGTFIGCYSENKTWSILSNIVLGGSTSVNNLRGAPQESKKLHLNENVTRVKVDIDNLGSGYTSAPTVTIDPPSGATRATAEAVVLNGRIEFIKMVDMGAGYGSAPTVTITDSTGSGATAISLIGSPQYQNDSFYGRVVFIQVVRKGSGYSNNPTITVSDPVVTQATATANLLSDGRVLSFTMTNKGSGYTVAPSVSITGGGGSGATATASLSRNDRTTVDIAQNDDELLSLSSSKYNVPLLMAYQNDGSGDIELRYGTQSSQKIMTIIGNATNKTNGRSGVDRNKPLFNNGIVLTARNVTMSSSIPPSSGDFARGDVIFAINPSASGVPGVVCTTGGAAGSTAVFSNMANLS